MSEANTVNGPSEKSDDSPAGNPWKFLPPADMKRAYAVIKDAEQYVAALLLCTLLIISAIFVPVWYIRTVFIPVTYLCAVIVPAKYAIRLSQWIALSNTYPTLTEAGGPKSIQARFGPSKRKLMLATTVGALMFGFYTIVLIALSWPV